MYIYWFSSESGYSRYDNADNAGRHSTTTRATYNQSARLYSAMENMSPDYQAACVNVYGQAVCN